MVRHAAPSHRRKRRRRDSSPTAHASISASASASAPASAPCPVPEDPSSPPPATKPTSRVNPALTASATLQEAPAVSLYEALSHLFPPESPTDHPPDNDHDPDPDTREREGIGRACDAYLDALHERVKNSLRKDPHFLRKRHSTRFSPPDPLLEPDSDRAKLYYMPELVYFLPFDLDNAFRPFCVACNSTLDVENNGWSRVRRVVGLTCSYFVTTRRYKCKNCNKTFLGWDDKILDRAPQYIADTFPAIFTRRLAVDKHLFRLYREALKSGSTSYRFAKMIRSLHTAEHHRRQSCFLAMAKADSQRFGCPMPAWPKHDASREEPEHPSASDLEDLPSAADGNQTPSATGPAAVYTHESRRDRGIKRKLAEQAAPRTATKIAPAPLISPKPAPTGVAPQPVTSKAAPSVPVTPPKLLPAPSVGRPMAAIGNMNVPGSIVPVPGGFFVPRILPGSPFKEYVPMRKARKTRTCVTCKASSCPGSQRRQNCVELRRKQVGKTPAPA